MAKNDSSLIPFLSAANSSTVEIHNLFFKSFRLVCRDTVSGFTYFFEDNKLKKRDLFSRHEPEIVLDLSEDSFNILQNIFTVMTIHHQELRLSQKQAEAKKHRAKGSVAQCNLRLRDVKPNTESADVRGRLRLAPDRY